MGNKRGVASYISVLLLILTTLGISALIYTQVITPLGKLEPAESTLETFSIDETRIEKKTIYIYVRNLGSDELNIDAVYLNNEKIAPGNIRINQKGTQDDKIAPDKVGLLAINYTKGFTQDKLYEIQIGTPGNTKKSTSIIYQPQEPTPTPPEPPTTTNNPHFLVYAANNQTPAKSKQDYIDLEETNLDVQPTKGTYDNFNNLRNTDNTFSTLTEETSISPETGYRVYNGSFEFNTGTQTTQSIGGTIDPDHSFLIMYTAGTSAPREPDEGSCHGYISSNTEITFTRETSSNGLYVSWFIIECLNQEFTVIQRAEATLNTGEETTQIPVSGVSDQAQCTVMYGGHSGSGNNRNDWEDTFCNVHLTQPDTLTVKRHTASTGSTTKIKYEIIEWDKEYKVYMGETQVSSTTVTDLISGSGQSDDPVVDPSRSIMFANWWTEQNGIQQVQVYYSITGTNEVTLGQYANGRNPLVRWYVIEFPESTPPNIQRFSYNWDPQNNDNTRSNTINAVNTSRTFIRMSCSTKGTGTAFRRDFNLPRLDSATSWSETQYNPANQDYDRHETRASVIELPYQPASINNEIDLESGFTDVEPYEENQLCIKTGDFSDEGLSLSIWDSTQWVELTSELNEDTWNNYTVTEYIEPSFSIRFKGEQEIADTITSNWNIDSVLLSQYTPPSDDYSIPHYRTFTDSWSEETQISYPAQGDIREIVVETCPVMPRRNETILVTLTTNGYLEAYVHDGEQWSSPTGITRLWTGIQSDAMRPFDLAYEASSGDAVLVYDNSIENNGFQELGYRVWDGINWSSEQYLDDPKDNWPAGIDYRWIRLAPDYNGSDSIGFIGVDSGWWEYSLAIWDGDTWTDWKRVSNGPSAIEYESIDIAWEYASGTCMAVMSDMMNIQYFTWDGLWSSRSSFTMDGNWWNWNWLSLKPEIKQGSERLMLLGIDTTAAASAIDWDGSNWNGNGIVLDSEMEASATRCLDGNWALDSTKYLVVGGDKDTNSLSYKTWSPDTGWSHPTDMWETYNAGNNPLGWVRVSSNYVNYEPFMSIGWMDESDTLGIAEWNGGALENGKIVSDDSPSIYDVYDIAYAKR